MNKCTEKESWKLALIKTKETIRIRIENDILKYNKNPTRCKQCQESLSYKSRKNKFCGHSCSASYTNKGVIRNSNRHIGCDVDKVSKKPKSTNCLFCGKMLNNNRKYCSQLCNTEHIKENNILYWKSNAHNIKVLPQYVRKYLMTQCNNTCECGWSKKNPYSNTYPLVVDHIDGNSENNVPENLRILCPSCDSLTSTYKGLNKGKGRAKRRQRYADGKSY